jgi:two-component system response regulator YcbB
VRIYIVEDDKNIVKLLSNIITDCDLGKVIGSANDGTTGYDEILMLQPDLVLVDLLMPGKDGISLVQEVKSVNGRIQFVMISQVSSKDMIGRAYQSGVEYFISKPINAIETESVIQKVKEKISMNRTLSQIQNIFAAKPDATSEIYRDLKDETIKRIFQKIGIVGEAGSQDIINIVKYLMDNGQSMSEFTVKEICGKFTDQSKSMEQRIRRTATVGMTNLAHLGIEDYMNETLSEFGNGLYSYEQIKAEMDYIRGKSNRRGKVNIRKFIDGLISYCTIKN